MKIAVNISGQQRPNQTHRSISRITLVFFIIILSACGGGSGGGSMTSENDFTDADYSGDWAQSSSASGALWYQSRVGEATIDANGDYSYAATQYSSGEFDTTLNTTGSTSITGTGFASAIEDPQTDIELGWMDSGKTLMSHVFTASDMTSPQIWAWLKRGTNYTNADWTGTWILHSLYQGVADRSWARTTFDINDNGTGTYSSIDSNSSGFSFDILDWYALFPIDSTGDISEVNEPELYTMDTGKTLLLDSSVSHAFQVGVKIGENYSLADLDGIWKSATIETESTTTTAYWERGNVTVTNGGAFDFAYTESDNTSGSGSGQFVISAQGEVTIVNSTVIDQLCHLDAGKTVMVCTHTHDSGAAGLSILTKSE